VDLHDIHRSCSFFPSFRQNAFFLFLQPRRQIWADLRSRPPGSNLSLRHSGVFPASNRVGGVKRCWGVWVGVGGLIRRFGTVHMAVWDGCRRRWVWVLMNGQADTDGCCV